MKMELIMIVWRGEEACDTVEGICDEIARKFGFTKLDCGQLPSGERLGCTYFRSAERFQLSLNTFGIAPHIKLHLKRAEGAVCVEAKRKLIESFNTSVQIIGEGEA
jgi:hypothetical protein